MSPRYRLAREPGARERGPRVPVGLGDDGDGPRGRQLQPGERLRGHSASPAPLPPWARREGSIGAFRYVAGCSSEAHACSDSGLAAEASAQGARSTPKHGERRERAKRANLRSSAGHCSPTDPRSCAGARPALFSCASCPLLTTHTTVPRETARAERCPAGHAARASAAGGAWRAAIASKRVPCCTRPDFAHAPAAASPLLGLPSRVGGSRLIHLSHQSQPAPRPDCYAAPPTSSLRRQPAPSALPRGNKAIQLRPPRKPGPAANRWVGFSGLAGEGGTEMRGPAPASSCAGEAPAPQARPAPANTQ